MNRRKPLFAGVIFTQEGQPVEATYVGEDACYVIPDGDFRRHIDAADIDRQVLAYLKEQIMGMKDTVVEGMLQLMESDDPFTRAAIEMNLENIDRIPDMEQNGINTEDLQLGLWMTGFRVIVDFHGQVLEVVLPGIEEPD